MEIYVDKEGKQLVQWLSDMALKAHGLQAITNVVKVQTAMNSIDSIAPAKPGCTDVFDTTATKPTPTTPPHSATIIS